ncbi:A24 family peptidase [Nitratidesulfovibrio liaohensis]|uniref:A24 family peptidase n=1 Tax=Nitratidesulfovibrio liaohensis TaxID=2604158 RepID=A0ABY9R0T2_9BACT|nr:A24 family peptidase [Nitratidesulfovibrio liaohensis]WMW65074.1 A24 family peptidase [Nitratidesulfovibrio liaohensis]
MNPILAAPLAAVLLVAVTTDLRAMRIPNWLTFPAMLAGVVANAALGAWTGGLSGAWDGLLFSLSGFGLGLGLMLIPFLLRVMGAGDVKLLAAAGAFLGAETVFRAFIWTSLAGGVYALGVLAFHLPQLRAVLRSLRVSVELLAVTGRFDYVPATANARLPRLCYGVAIALGTGLAMAQAAFPSAMSALLPAWAAIL